MKVIQREGETIIEITRWDIFKQRVAHFFGRCDGNCPHCYHEACEWLEKQKREKNYHEKI